MESGPVSATHQVYSASGGGQHPSHPPGKGHSRTARVIERRFPRPDYFANPHAAARCGSIERCAGIKQHGCARDAMHRGRETSQHRRIVLPGREVQRRDTIDVTRTERAHRLCLDLSPPGTGARGLPPAVRVHLRVGRRHHCIITIRGNSGLQHMLISRHCVNLSNCPCVA
jgi:hypothetical protein